MDGLKMIITLGWPFSLRGPAELRGFLRKPADFAIRPGGPFGAPFRSLRALLLATSPSVKNPRSGSTENAVITNQWLTRGLFKRLDASLPTRRKQASYGYPSALILPRYITCLLNTLEDLLCRTSSGCVLLPADGGRSLFHLVHRQTQARQRHHRRVSRSRCWCSTHPLSGRLQPTQRGIPMSSTAANCRGRIPQSIDAWPRCRQIPPPP